MTNPVPEHEKLFNDICNKLNELGTQAEGEVAAMPTQPKYEQMQVQMKKFHSELVGSQEEYREKIRNLENVSYETETLDSQLKQMAEHLSAERMNNTKLSADLAKSLELSLQLQLEIQGLKARSLQIQGEEKKYSQALYDKSRILQKELELMTVMKNEATAELANAKATFSKELQTWIEQKNQYEAHIQTIETEKTQLAAKIQAQSQTIQEKDTAMSELHEEIEKISASYSDVEASALQQNEVLKSITSVAESKIIEIKMALDKKSLEAQDYYSHLQQALTQVGVLKQENGAMKEYVQKLNYYHQQAQHAQNAVAQMAQVAANQVQPQQPQQQAALHAPVVGNA